MPRRTITTAEFFATRERYNKETDRTRAKLRKLKDEYDRFVSAYNSQSPQGWGA